jgi:hypothetical protein
MIADLDETFIATVRAHLASAHPGRAYSDNEIMMISFPVPDRIVRAADGS